MFINPLELTPKTQHKANTTAPKLAFRTAEVDANRIFFSNSFATISHEEREKMTGNEKILSSESALDGEGNTKYPLHIVFDMDETLLTTKENMKTILRPFAEEMLNSLHLHGAELILWTAATYEHVEECQKEFPKVFQYFHHVIDRSECSHLVKGNTEFGLKDLRRLGRDLNRTIFIDNDEIHLGWNSANMLLIKDFYGDPSDCELKNLGELLLLLIKTNSTTVTDFLSSNGLLHKLLSPVHPSPYHQYVSDAKIALFKNTKEGKLDDFNKLGTKLQGLLNQDKINFGVYFPLLVQLDNGEFTKVAEAIAAIDLTSSRATATSSSDIPAASIPVLETKPIPSPESPSIFTPPVLDIPEEMDDPQPVILPPAVEECKPVAKKKSLLDSIKNNIKRKKLEKRLNKTTKKKDEKITSKVKSSIKKLFSLPWKKGELKAKANSPPLQDLKIK